MQGFPTTNHYGATADGLIIAYRAGARLRDMDSCQYHPSGSIYPRQIYGRLCTEKFRSVGAQPVNRHGELFVHPLEPRNVEASMFIKECYENDNGVETPGGLRGVWIDVPILELIHGEGYVSTHFGAEYRAMKRFDIDISEEPILVYPTIHFQNGGIDINDRAETTVPGLFAAGEVTGGVHGANREGGNALTECIVFGDIAGESAARYAVGAPRGKIREERFRHIFLGEDERQRGKNLFKEVQDLTSAHAGPIRDAKSLEEGLSRVSEIEKQLSGLEKGGKSVGLNEVKGSLLVSKAIMRASLEREESRGAFYREDFPTRDDTNWLKNILLKLDRETGDFVVSHRRIGNAIQKGNERVKS